MKKIFLISASVLALGVGNAMAASSVINDAGTGNVNTVTQTGATGASSSTISQAASTSFGVADVDQVGAGTNTSFITQVGTTSATADVTQTAGGPNPSNNTAVNQGSALGGGSNFSAIVVQNRPGNGTGAPNQVSVDQGTNSVSSVLTANISQLNGRNEAYVKQDGNGVNAIVTQSSGAFALVTQNGNNLFSTNTQVRESYLEVSQTGADHSSTITQNSGVNLGHEAFVTQGGSGQISQIFQSGSTNFAEVSQMATNNNFSTITQSGTDGTSIVMQ